MLAHKSEFKVTLFKVAFALPMLHGVCLAQTANSPFLSAPVKKLNLPSVMSQAPLWQKAPQSIGEYLPFPNDEASGIAHWNGRTLVGTGRGLLSSTARNQWKIVPELYGRNLRPLGEKNGLLWLVEENSRLLAVDKNFAVKKTFEPVKAPFMLNFDMNSFWRLDEKFFATDWRWDNENSLVEYGPDGQEKQVTDTFSVLDNAPDWMAIDADTIWVADVSIAGWRNSPQEKNLIRINRATGKATAVDISKRLPSTYPRPTFANLPDCILWIGSPDGKGSVLYQLDKKSLLISTVRNFNQRIGASNLIADSKNLWIFPGLRGQPLVLSLRDYKAVTPQISGSVPPGSPAPSSYEEPSGATPYYKLLGSYASRVWLMTPGPALMELRDDGTATARNLGALFLSPAEPYEEGKSSQNSLYFEFQGGLIAAQVGTAPVFVWRLPDFRPGESAFRLVNANDQRVWLMVYKLDGSNTAELVALAPDLSQQCSSGLQSDIFQMRSVPIKDDLYYFWNGIVRKMNGKTGQISEIVSLKEQLPDLQSEMIYRANEFHRGCSRGFILPDNRIAFLFSALLRFSPGKMETKGQPVALFYDPQHDKWQSQPQETLPYDVISAGAKLYGIHDEDYEKALVRYNLTEWQDDHWLQRSLCALPSLNTFHLLGTTHYLYSSTPLGLYRVAWSQLMENAK